MHGARCVRSIACPSVARTNGGPCRRCRARFRQLPAAEQKLVAPALLNGLGKVQLGTGDYAGATKSFTETARIVPRGGGEGRGSR